MRLQLHIVWGSKKNPQDDFVCMFNLPFLPIIGMEFKLSTLDPETNLLHILPTLIVERVVLLLGGDEKKKYKKDPIVDIYFKHLPEATMNDILPNLRKDKNWYQ
jgi:hypothetical protein